MVREVASKTNDLPATAPPPHGAAASIMKEGLKLVAAGMNPMDLSAASTSRPQSSDIERAKKVQSSDEIAQIRTSANGDKTIGKMIADAMKKSATRVITVEEPDR
jgi:chaperonin GroEL